MSSIASRYSRAARFGRRREQGVVDRRLARAVKLERAAKRLLNGEPEGLGTERRADAAGGMLLLAALYRHHGHPPRDCADSVADTMMFDWRARQLVAGAAGSPAAMCASVA